MSDELSEDRAREPVKIKDWAALVATLLGLQDDLILPGEWTLETAIAGELDELDGVEIAILIESRFGIVLGEEAILAFGTVRDLAVHIAGLLRVAVKEAEAAPPPSEAGGKGEPRKKRKKEN